MATKPTSVPFWATAGLITVPMAGKIASGWLVAEKPPAQYFNWHQNLTGQWCDYLNDIENHPLIWLAIQTFNFGINVSQATVNADGTVTQGNGTGYGLFARGGTNGGGVRAFAGIGALTAAGVWARGDISGANGGPGILAQGGTQSPGGVFEGNGTGCGLRATGGATNANGIEAGSTGSGHGIKVLTGGVRLDDNTKSVAFTTAKSYVCNARGLLWVDTAEWSANIGGYYWGQSNAPDAGGTQTPISWIMDVPAGSTITDVTVRIAPPGGHMVLPNVLPSLQIKEYNPANATDSTIANQSDTSPDVATYEAAHNIAATGLSYTTTRGRMIIVHVYGEKGNMAAPAIDGGTYYSPIVTYTRAQIGEE